MTNAEALESKKQLVALWTEQLKNANQGIAARVDLQLRNANVNIVLLTAMLGYIVNFLASHGYAQLTKSEVILVAAIAPLISNVFIWRHVDHEANIIDHARYVNGVIRPAFARLNGEDSLQWEEFLNLSRLQRPRRTVALSILGNEAVLMFVGAVPFLVLAWVVRFSGKGYAGTASGLFTSLTYLATLASVTSLYLLVTALIAYARLAVPPGKSPSSDKRVERPAAIPRIRRKRD